MSETKEVQKPKKKLPERKCVGCNERKPKPELVRIVRVPEGEILLDRTGKKSGRGAYLCYNTACLAKAVKAHRLQNALSCEIPDSVITALKGELAEHDK